MIYRELLKDIDTLLGIFYDQINILKLYFMYAWREEKQHSFHVLEFFQNFEFNSML